MKLRPTALYLLGRELDNPNGLYSRKAIKAILQAAETEWVNEDRAEEKDVTDWVLRGGIPHGYMLDVFEVTAVEVADEE